MCKCPNNQLFRLYAIVVLIGFIISPILVTATETLTWVEEHFPPIWILEGPDKGEGILDGLLSIYEKNLPEYKHRYITANIARVLAMMKAGQNVCHAGMLKSSDREHFIYFSLPNAITTLHTIVFKKNRRHSFFDSVQQVSLKDLLENTPLTLGVAKGSSYGTAIDAILGIQKKTGKIVFRSGQDIHAGLLKMLLEERIDYMIGYSWEIMYLANQMNMSDTIAAIDITELAGQQWLITYVGCTKNEWGRQVIEELNAFLPEVRGSDEYLLHALKWMPESVKLDARNAFEERVLTVTE